MTAKMIHCQTCGYEEPCKDIVVYCSQCEIVMIHRYCMDGPLRHDVEEWCCEECCPRLPEQEEALMENQHLKDILDQDLKEGSPSENDCMKYQYFKIGVSQNIDSQEAEQVMHPIEYTLDIIDETSKGCCFHTCENEREGHPLKTNEAQNLKEEICWEIDSHVHNGDSMQMHSMKEASKECCPTSGNEEKCKEGQSLVNNEAQSMEKTFLDDYHPLKQTSYDVFPRPIYYQVWRGNFLIHHDMHECVPLHMVAHLCDIASPKVADVAVTLPETLELEIVPKCSNLPKSFTTSTPIGGDIGLYFFPTDDSGEKQCSRLVEKMIDGDFILKFTTSNLNLLVFTSWELPRELWSFNNKLYLWGAFCSATPTSSFSTKIRSTTNAKCGSMKNNFYGNIPRCVDQSLPAFPTKFQRGGRVDRTKRHHRPHQNIIKNNQKRCHRILRNSPNEDYY